LQHREQHRLHERHNARRFARGGGFPARANIAGVGEARSHRRLSDAPLLVAYTIGDEFAAAHTQTYDVGLGGLAMLGDTELASGTELRLELELRGDPRPPLHLTGEVRWSRYDAALSKYRIGIEFTNRTQEQESQLMGYIDMMYKLRDLGVL
jgi:c-di-GMP-binding flagellar brake protein YcgR